MPVGRTPRSIFARLLPKGLAARLALTIVLTNLVVVVAVLVLAGLALRSFVPQLQEDRARSALGQISQGVSSQAAAADISMTVLETAARMRAAGLDGTLPEDLSDTLDAYAKRVGAIALVFSNPAGDTLYSYGRPEDVAVLELTLAAEGSSWQPGALRVGDIVTVAAVRPIVGTGTGTNAGSIAIARPFNPAALDLPGSLEVGTAERTISDLDNARVLENPPFEDVHVGSTENELLIDAEIPGVNRLTAATIYYHEPATVFPQASGYWTIALAGIALVLLLGGVAGLLVARAVALPIIDASSHLETYSAEARAGRPVEQPAPNELLPREFAVLQETLFQTFVDLGEHQQALSHAKEEAEAANAMLAVAVHDSLEGKIVAAEGTVLLANPAAVAHLALPPGWEGAPLGDLFSSTRLETVDGDPVVVEELLTQMASRPQIVRVIAPGRAARCVEMRSAPHEARRSLLLITTQDITEQRRLDELRNEIIGLVTHDLRAPLTVIAGYLDLLGRQAEDPTTSKAVEAAQRSASRMKELLEDLLSATRAEEMFAPTEFVRVSLRELSEEVVSSFRHTSPHELKLFADADAVVIGEERRIRQVLVNLVTNAMKYSPANTEIAVRLTVDEGSALVVVEDQGPGVPEEDRERIFERFARLGTDDQGRSPGVGLGLYIVKAIVESHGGSVVVEDRDDDTGARFVVRLPLAAPENSGR